MAINNNAEINSYLEGLQKTNPPLYNLLRLLSDDLNYITDTLIPDTVQSTLAQINVPAPIPRPPTIFIGTVLGGGIKFDWFSDDLNAIQFEVREGLVWETSTFLFRTIGLTATINPIVGLSSHHFFIRSLNIDGVYSETSNSIDLTVFSPGNVVVSYQVIDNNVLLSWSISPAPGSFIIDHYEIYRNGVLIGTQASTFFVYFESAPGTVIYGIKPVDLAGNVGIIANVSVSVNEPPDFVLYDSRISNFGGTKNSIILEAGNLVGPYNLTETWANHFSSRGWNNIGDQAAAGYNRYGLPAKATGGSYVEVFDFGAVLNNVIVNADWISTVITSTAGLNVQFETSLDNITYAAPVAGPSVFFASFRYIRLTLNFTSDGFGIISVSQLRIFIDVKLVLTSGSVSSVLTDNAIATGSTHLGGTYVLFTKAYKDVDSITLTTDSLSPITPIFDFIKVVNPDGFKVYAFDSSGNRVTQTINWKVRGRL